MCRARVTGRAPTRRPTVTASSSAVAAGPSGSAAEVLSSRVVATGTGTCATIPARQHVIAVRSCGSAGAAPLARQQGRCAHEESAGPHDAPVAPATPSVWTSASSSATTNVAGLLTVSPYPDLGMRQAPRVALSLQGEGASYFGRSDAAPSERRERSLARSLERAVRRDLSRRRRSRSVPARLHRLWVPCTCARRRAGDDYAVRSRRRCGPAAELPRGGVPRRRRPTRGRPRSEALARLTVSGRAFGGLPQSHGLRADCFVRPPFIREESSCSHTHQREPRW